MLKDEETQEEETEEEESEDSEESDEEESDEESEEEDDSDEEDDEDDEEDEDEGEEDWESIAKNERAARKKAELKLAGKRFKSRHEDEDDSEDDDDEDDDKPLTGKRLKKLLAQEREVTQRTLEKGQVKKYALKLAKSDAEARAIVEIYNRRSFPAGMDLKDKIKEAYFIAHGPKLLGKNSELKRSLRTKKSVKKSGDEGTQRDDKVKNSEPKMQASDRAEMKRLGYKWDPTKGDAGLYLKKVNSKKTLARDPKTGKTFIIQN